MKVDAIFVLACIVAWVGTADAEGEATSSRTYTLADCVRIGLERSGVARNARLDQDIARARHQQALSEALPHVSLNGTYTRLDELQDITFGNETIELGTLDNYSVDAAVRQTLYAGGKISAALGAAHLNRDYAGWSRAEAESKLTRDISIAYHDVLLAQGSVKVHEETLAQLQALLKQAENKYASGTVSEYDVLSARVRVNNQRPELIRARNALELVRENLRRLADLDAGAFALSGELAQTAQPDGAEEQLEDRAIRSRPAVLMQEDLVQLREKDVISARSAGMPSLKASVSYAGANSYGFVGLQNAWEWHWNAALALEWDIWNGGLTRGIVAEKETELRKSRTDLEELKKSVCLEVRQAHLDLRHAQQSIEASRGNVALAERALSIAEKRYETGVATYLEYTDATVSLGRAKLSLLQSLCDHMNAIARLRHAVGPAPVTSRE